MATKKSNNVKIELPKKTIDIKNPVLKDGTMYNSHEAMEQHVLFVPDEPGENPDLKYKCSGQLNSYADGTVEFIRTVRKRSVAERLAKTDYGLLSKTADGYYLVQFRIPADGKHNYSKIIRNESLEIADVLSYEA